MTRTEKNTRRFLLAQLNTERRLDSWARGIKRNDLRSFKGTIRQLHNAIRRARHA